MNRKYVKVILLSVILTALLILFVSQMQPRKKLDPDAAQEYAHLLYSGTVAEEALSGYEKSENALIVTNDDPQIYFDTSGCGNISVVSLWFADTIQNKLSIQVFYNDGHGFSEQGSKWGACYPGTQRVDINIPEGNYRELRIDIEGDSVIPLESVVVWDEYAAPPIISLFQWILFALGSLVVLIPCLLLMDSGKVLRFRIGAGILAFAFSVLFVVLMKNRLEIAGAFSFFDLDKLIVTGSDIVSTMLVLFGCALCSRPFRKRFGLREAWFDGTEKLYLGFCAVVYCFWMLTFSGTAYAPDEAMRYDIPKFIFQTGTLPKGWEESIRNGYWGVSYGFDISLPYLHSSYLMGLFSLFFTPGDMLLMAARLSSLLYTVGTAAAAILIGRRMLPGKPARWIFIVLMSMLPQVVFLASYVNLDSFSLLTVMLIAYCWMLCLDDGWSVRSCSWLAVSIGLCFLSYKFAYGYILMSVLVYVVWYLMNRKTFSFGTFVKRGLLIVGIAFVICGWKFIRNAILYNGDFLSLNASKPYAELYAADVVKPSLVQTYANSGVGLVEMLRITPWIKDTSLSLVGAFGSQRNVFMPEWFYQVYNAVLLVGVIASVTLLLPGRKKTANGILLFSGMGLASLTAFLVSLYFSWTGDYQAQGRYIITILPFVFLLESMGYDRLLELVVPRRIREESNVSRAFSICLSAFVILMMIAGYVRCLEFFEILKI